MKSSKKRNNGWLIGGIIGFILGLLIFMYMNYLPPYCTEYPICTHEEAIKPGAECCPDVGHFSCIGPVQSSNCKLFVYLINPFSYMLAIPFALIGILFGYLLNKLKIKKRN